MTEKENGEIELIETPDYNQSIVAVENLRRSLNPKDEERASVFAESPDSFEDVHFDLLPSLSELDDIDVVAPYTPPQEKDDSLSLVFTLSQEDEFTPEPSLGITRALLFRFAPDGSLWLLDNSEESLFRFSHFTDTALSHTFTIPRGTEKFSIGYPGNLLVDGEGNLYILDVIQQVVHKFSSEGEYDTNFQDRLMAETPLSSARDFDILETANLIIVSDYVKGILKKIALDGSGQGEVVLREGPAPQAFETPTGVAILPDGNCFVSDPAKKAVLELDPEGKRIGGFFLDERTQQQASFCSLMQGTPDGSLFLIDFYAQCIHSYKRDGQLWGIFRAGPESPAPDLHLGFFDITQDGKLFFIDPQTSRIHCLHF